MATAWPLLDPHNIRQSFPKFATAAYAGLSRLGKASAAGAIQHYQVQRLGAGVRSAPPRLVMPPPITHDQVLGYLGNGIKGLYGPVTPEAVAAAKVNAQGSAEQLVLGQGRDALKTAVDNDPKARGWVREIEPDACAFCAMLASRGVTTESQADFAAHDHCQCFPEPVFSGQEWEPSEAVQDAIDQWSASTGGLRSKDARLAFRQQREGRPVTALDTSEVRRVKARNERRIAQIQAEIQDWTAKNTDGRYDEVIRQYRKQIADLQNEINTVKPNNPRS